MSDVMTWWYYMTAVWWNFNRYACRLDTIQSDIPPGPLKIKEKSYSTNAPPSGMPTNTVKLYQARLLLHCRCNIHPCWSSATLCRELLSCCSCNIYACLPSVFPATNTATVWVLLQDGCMLDRCHSIMPANLLPLNPVCLLMLCFSIFHTCWHGASLSAVPDGVVCHYRPYLLVRCLTISRAYCCGATL